MYLDAVYSTAGARAKAWLRGRARARTRGCVTYIVLPSCSLQHSCEESGGKSEPRQPEQHRRVSGGGPHSKLVHSCRQITCPCPKGFL